MSRAKTITSWIVSMLVMGLVEAGAGPIVAEPYQSDRCHGRRHHYRGCSMEGGCP